MGAGEAPATTLARAAWLAALRGRPEHPHNSSRADRGLLPAAGAHTPAAQQDSHTRGPPEFVPAGRRHHLQTRFGLFGPKIVLAMRSDMLTLDPRIDEYNSTRQVFDQLAVFIMIVAAVYGVIVLWDVGGVSACLGAVWKEVERMIPTQRNTAREDGSNSTAAENQSGFIGALMGAAGGEARTKARVETAAASSNARGQASPPGLLASLTLGVFGTGRDGGQSRPEAQAEQQAGGATFVQSIEKMTGLDIDRDGFIGAPPSSGRKSQAAGPTFVHSLEKMTGLDIDRDGVVGTPPPSTQPEHTWTQRLGLSAAVSGVQDGKDSESTAFSLAKLGMGLEVPWEPTPTLFFVLGVFCQLPLMIALSCYSFFSEMFAGAGADGMAYFPIIVSLAQLITAASVSAVLREWSWMVKAVLGLLIVVPALLIIPIVAYPYGGAASLFCVSLAIGLSAGLSTVLLAMALACESDPEEQELTNRSSAGLSHRSADSSGGNKNLKRLTALQVGMATGAILVVLLWMLVKAAGQQSRHYADSRNAVMNGGRIELMLASAGCIFGAYLCARVCAGRFDDSSLIHTDAEVEQHVIQIVRPYAVALMLNSICSTLLFPRLIDSAPSRWGVRPDWLGADLTLLYCVADLTGRVFSQEFFAFLKSNPAVSNWQQAQGARAMVWIATIRGTSLSIFILLAIACGWQDDGLLIVYVVLTGLSHGLLSVGFLQTGARAAKAIGWRVSGKASGLHLSSASAFGVGDALGSVLGFLLASGLWA